MSHVDPVHKIGYASGYSALDWAEQIIATSVASAREVFIERRTDPDAYPGYLLPPDDLSVARSIVGKLLAAGWEPPSPEDVARWAAEASESGFGETP